MYTEVVLHVTNTEWVSLWQQDNKMSETGALRHRPIPTTSSTESPPAKETDPLPAPKGEPSPEDQAQDAAALMNARES
jgi:hypothetical protein